jgi:hypothetical protein
MVERDLRFMIARPASSNIVVSTAVMADEGVAMEAIRLDDDYNNCVEPMCRSPRIAPEHSKK